MKTLRLFVLTLTLLVFTTIVYAQDYDFYLQKARQRISEGDCDGAQRNYNVYMELAKKTNKDIELQLMNCGSNSMLVAPYVYYVMSSSLEITLSDGRIIDIDCSSTGLAWAGTGFLLEDGTFVTSRQVVEPWYFWKNGSEVQETFLEMNTIVENGGKILVHYIAASSSGNVFEFTSRQVRCSRDKDLHDTYDTDSGVVSVSLAKGNDTDCAIVKTLMRSGLKYDSEMSTSMQANTDLTIMGFPYGFGVQRIDDQQFGNISPIKAQAAVALDGLYDGMIVTTDTGYDPGNEGAPAFFINDSGKLVVIGIVSASISNNMGLIVPISAIDKLKLNY